MQHLDEGTIHAWLDGALGASDARRIEAHLAECTACASAVAEARGLMAASSRILSALDMVPRDVVPRTQADDVPPRAEAMRNAPVGRARRRWLPRVSRIAAVAAFVAVGATIAARVFGVHTPPPSQTIHVDADAGTHAAASPSASVAGVSPTPAPNLDTVAAPKAAAPPAPPTSTRSQPTATKTAAVKATATKPTAEQVHALDRALAEAKREAAVREAADANAERMVAASDVQRVAPDTLPRLVSTAQVRTVIGSVVQRRIYEVRPGVRVTLEEAAAPRSNFAEPLEARQTARESPPVTAPVIAFPPKPSPAAAFGARAAATDSVVLNSIQWTDSTGARFTLSGPLSVEELRRIKAVLH